MLTACFRCESQIKISRNIPQENFRSINNKLETIDGTSIVSNSGIKLHTCITDDVNVIKKHSKNSTDEFQTTA